MKPHERPHWISDDEFDREFLGTAVVDKDDDPFIDDRTGLDESRIEELQDGYDYEEM